MKSLVVVLLLAGFSLSALGQTAKVIQLSPEDAAQAKSLYAQQAAIQKKIDALNDKITTQYTSEAVPEGNCIATAYGSWVFSGPCSGMGAPTSSVKPGWENGFEFSEDFKFIVPKPIPPQTLSNCSLSSGCITYGGMYTTTPIAAN